MSDVSRENLEELFADFKRRLLAGENPDAVDYLERVGDDVEQLAVRIAGLLATSTPPMPSKDAVAEMLKEPALATHSEAETFGAVLAGWRHARGEQRAAFARKLAVELGVGERGDKVKRYYADLENDLLPPANLDPRVSSSITKLLGIPRARLAALAEAWKPPHPPSAMAYSRAASEAIDRKRASSEAVSDEVDRLFGKGA